MSGVKGKSGRKGYNEEREINEIIQLSSKTILQYLRHEDYPLNKKVVIATEFMKRRVAERKEIKADILTKEDRQYIQDLALINRNKYISNTN